MVASEHKSDIELTNFTPNLHGRNMGHLLWGFGGKKLPRFNDTALYSEVCFQNVIVAESYPPLPNIAFRKVFNIRRTKFQNLNYSRLVLWLSLLNLLKPGVK